MIGTYRLKTMLLTIFILGIGFYLGSIYTGMEAQATYRFEMPEWIQTVRTAQSIVLGIIGLAAILWIVVDYVEHR